VRVTNRARPPAPLIFEENRRTTAFADGKNPYKNAKRNASYAVVTHAARKGFKAAIEMLGSDQRVIARAGCDLFGIADPENGARIALPVHASGSEVPDIGGFIDRREDADEIETRRARGRSNAARGGVA
jgi:hypothetical protein